MRVTLVVTIMAIQNLSAQSDVGKWFDFWVGKWDASWDEGEGKVGRGTNTITKVLDGTVQRGFWDRRTGEFSADLRR